jgi:hypothetical protein
MDDEALDHLLQRAAPEPPPAAVETALLIARRTAEAQRRSRRPLSRRPVLAVALGAAALLLAGAGTVRAYQLGIAPFQSLDPGSERAAGVPIDYTNSLGKKVTCQAFTEWEDLTSTQRTVLANLPDDPYWVGYGDRVLADRHLQDAPVLDQEKAVFDRATEDVRHRAEVALASTTGLSPAAYHGFSITCAPGGADGQ